MVILILVIIGLALPTTTTAQDSAADRAAQCHEWHECRQLALDAAARGDYERFHDLAWRAVQTGPPRDAALMYLLARAQSLSGRPHDALVMLGRIADMQVPTDAATNPDFQAVRTLKEWPELESRLGEPGAPKNTETESPVAPSPPAAAAAPGTSAPRAAASVYHPEEAVRVPDVDFTPRGLAYDAVSSRFVVADPASRKLVIFDERSHRAVDLVRASSTGFSDVAAFEIDPRRGDLWVVSVDAAGGGTSSSDSLVSLHKLQLVSGRQLASFPLPAELAAVRICDVAVTPGGTVLMLDDEGGRIIAFDPDAHRFTAVATLQASGPASLAPADDHSVYVAQSNGLSYVDLSSGHASAMQPTNGGSLDGLVRIRWAHGALVGLQRKPGGTFAAVQVKISAHRATVEQIGDTLSEISDPTAVTLSGRDLYVLTRGSRRGPDGQPDVLIERFRLK